LTFAASSKVEGRRQSKTATLKWRGTKMPTVALQVTVTDYAKWRPVFDKYRSYRAEAGFKNERVFPPAITSLCDSDDLIHELVLQPRRNTHYDPEDNKDRASLRSMLTFSSRGGDITNPSI
jgi:hypothetical protein